MSDRKETYVNDQRDLRERVRLKKQEEVLNKAITSFDGLTLPQDAEVLDIACGSGLWCIDLAKANPGMRITGIDSSSGFLEFARDQAKLAKVSVGFLEMNALEPLKFEDESFDVVNARLIMPFMKPSRTVWPALLAECMRVLKPNGLIVITDQEIVLSNDYTLDAIWKPMYGAVHIGEYTFASDSDMAHLCNAIMIPSLLRKSEFADVHHRSFDVDFSTGSEGHEPLFKNFIAAFENGGPFLLKLGIVTPEEIKESQAYLKSLIGKDDFVAFWHFISSYGRKPS